MAGYRGVWIDRKEAWIAEPNSDQIKKLASQITPYHRSTGGGRHRIIHGLAGQINDKSLKRKHEQQKQRFYDRIRNRLSDSDEIFIVGPGSAKKELLQALEADPSFSKKKIAWQTSERLTERQFLALLSKHFGKAAYFET